MKEFLPDGMDFDDTISKAKEAIEIIENEFYRREKKKPKKHVHRFYFMKKPLKMMKNNQFLQKN